MRSLFVGLIVLGSLACTRARVADSASPRSSAGSDVTTEIGVSTASRMGALEAFVPAVAAVEEGGECDTVRIARADDPVTLIILSFPRTDAPTRNVSVTYDSAGQRLRYNDLRGDLRREKTGPQTSILLDFSRRTAFATNEVPGRPAEIATGDLASALTAAHLGLPQRMLDLVQTRCGAP
jgi:YD repeat-containing protein